MSESNLTSALCAFHKDVATIHKEARGNFGHYADMATVLSAVLPALSKNGLAITQTFIPTEGLPILRTTLRHVSGETVDSDLPMIIGSGRNPLHDFGGATTYLRRYSLLSILGLAAGIEDDDGDHADDKPQTSKKPAPAPASAKKAAKPEPSTTQPVANPPLPPEERELALELLKDRKKNDAERFAEFLPAFRKEFGLAADAPVATAIQEQKHVEFATAFFA